MADAPSGSLSWGIALSGGGAPGVAAHIGFLASLQAAGLWPDVIVGASAGGIVAGSLAAGATLQSMDAQWSRLGRRPWALIAAEVFHAAEMLRPETQPGILDMLSAVRATFHAGPLAAPDLEVKKWSLGYGVVVSDMTDARSVLLTANGAPLWLTTKVLAASAAFPPLFSGIRGPNGHLYADGGLYADVPVRMVRALGARRVLAVRIGAPLAVGPVLTLEAYAHATLQRLIDAADRAADPPADITLDITTQGRLFSLEHWGADLLAGQQAAQANLTAIRALAGAASPATAPAPAAPA